MIYFYSSHGAAFNPSKNRMDMSEAIVKDVKEHGYTYSVVGGDFNCVGEGDKSAISEIFPLDGFKWPSKNIGRTINEIRWFISFFPKNAFATDHIFSKGFGNFTSGKIDKHIVSDHMVIWTKLSDMNENN
jgi:endonuclease/exonuclease/phosphatase family metal-dependent hydrolase